MTVALWIVAGLLAAILLAAAGMKLTRSKEQLAASGQGWVESFSPAAVRTIGVLELLAAVGLIVPGLLSLATVFVPLAATGAGLLMVGAVITHLRRREWALAVVGIVILAMCTFVAWGRFGPYPL